MANYAKEAKEKLDEILTDFNQYTARIEKIENRIEKIKEELSELNQDEHFDKYHSKNQEVEYYQKQLAKAVDEYESKRGLNRLEIEGGLYSPIIRGLKKAKGSSNYEVEKDRIVTGFTKKMEALGKKHNQAVIEYFEVIYPELEELKDHFADTDFKHINLMQATTPHYHFRNPFTEYLKEVAE